MDACGATSCNVNVDALMDEAEAKAIDALGRYKFQMFGYWAAIWVHWNHVRPTKRRSPFRDLVVLARSMSAAQPQGVFMHDAIGRPLKEGDRVFVPAVVTGVFAGEDYCNVQVDTVIGRRPDNKPERISGINSGVFLRANPGDANDIEKWASPDGKWLGEQAVTLPFKTRVRDKVTGFTGVITGRGQWIDEPDTFLVVTEKGESRWIKTHHVEPLDTASAA